MSSFFRFEGYKTRVTRNPNMGKLQAGYLFPEVCNATGPFWFCYSSSSVMSFRSQALGLMITRCIVVFIHYACLPRMLCFAIRIVLQIFVSNPAQREIPFVPRNWNSVNALLVQTCVCLSRLDLYYAGSHN